ncbi:M1 family aminopeptidase [Actinoplanes couchii]|uniref:Aminopeptidase N n=1 Tax=Actinoplanes couchii TaxID=403638 RepID=A0ABQ3XTG8_9ACTN|nr:M1 family aminopeptidase [Actinoplanes couchii]MDR6319052.1 aminopeptidase N [Actinoplanes couchii]GID61758.1 aminopeptidase [Actinoplanes couchii]
MSLTLDEARRRAAMLADVSYELALDVTSTEAFHSRATVRFDTRGGDTFLELHRAEQLQVTIDGDVVTTAYDGRRIPLDGLTPGRHEVVVDARLRYVTDGEGLHTFTDPADGERYVGAYLGLDVTQRLFACFDQLDLKSPITLTVTADPAWTVLTNALPVDGTTFAATPPIPCDQLVVVAGPYHSIRWEHRGLPMGWHCRRSLAAELDRDAAELRRVTELCFDHYATIFTEPYPFDSYDQVFVPELNWGAMENPGCVTYNESMLPRGPVTDDDRRRRAMVIAHEMSHMWFANLVSPVWWEDAWLNESFADYMGFQVAETVAGFPGTRVSFEAAHKPGAYRADRRRSTHPVAPAAADVPDVATGRTIFDEISYGKGNAVIRQLVTWLGEPDFLAGVNAHLTRHRFANATLDDLLSALDAASPRDVRAWAAVWLRQAGHDTIRVTRRDDGVPVLTRDGIRPHRFTVTAYTLDLEPAGSRLIDLAAEAVPLPDWAGLVVVPNAHGETFARIHLDQLSSGAVANGLADLADPLVRAVLWSTVPIEELLPRQLPREPSPTLVAAAVDRALACSRQVTGVFDVIAAACAPTGEPDRQLALAAGLARTTTDITLLRRWLDGDAVNPGVPLSPDLRWTVVHRLAELGDLEAPEIETERQHDGTATGELGAHTALAARPTTAAKAEAWAAMTEDAGISVRRFRALAAGLWSPSQRDLVAPYIRAYVEAAPALARRGSAFASAVGRSFPALPLSEDELTLFHEALTGEVPTVLRRRWADELDDRSPENTDRR